MFQKQREGLKCIEELFKEYFQKDPLVNFYLLNFKIIGIIKDRSRILNNSAKTNGLTPAAKTFSHPVKLDNHITPNK